MEVTFHLGGAVVAISMGECCRISSLISQTLASATVERQLPPLNCGACQGLGDERANSAAFAHAYRNNSATEMECDFHAGQYAKIVAGSAQTAEEYYWQTRAYNELARQAFSHLADLPPSAEVHELLAKIHFSQK